MKRPDWQIRKHDFTVVYCFQDLYKDLTDIGHNFPTHSLFYIECWYRSCTFICWDGWGYTLQHPAVIFRLSVCRWGTTASVSSAPIGYELRMAEFESKICICKFHLQLNSWYSKIFKEFGFLNYNAVWLKIIHCSSISFSD